VSTVAFVDDHEVHRVVEYLKQLGEPDYIDTILQDSLDGIPGVDADLRGAGELEEQDPLFDEAVRIVTESRRASISGVQRRLKIGYNRAARMIEEMKRIGVVGPAETNGNREVLARSTHQRTDREDACSSTPNGRPAVLHAQSAQARPCSNLRALARDLVGAVGRREGRRGGSAERLPQGS